MKGEKGTDEKETWRKIHSKARGCCEASWEVDDVKERGERKGEWEEKRGSQGIQQRFLLECLVSMCVSVSLVVDERVKGAAETPLASAQHLCPMGY